MANIAAQRGHILYCSTRKQKFSADRQIQSSEAGRLGVHGVPRTCTQAWLKFGALAGWSLGMRLFTFWTRYFLTCFLFPAQ